jgi:hypothetical protein
MTVRGGIPADLSNGVGKVYNLCRVKSIRIAASSVMTVGMAILNLCQVLVLEKGFLGKMELCRTEYLEGTAMARRWIGVLGGYCRCLEVVMFD